MSRKKCDKSVAYEAVPASMFLPAVPIPHETMLNSAAKKDGRIKRDEYLIRGVTTQMTSVEEASEHRVELLKECKRRLECEHDPSAILKLLNDHPELIGDPWVRAKCHQLAAHGRLRRPRGRPSGTFSVHPLLIRGLVDECVAAGVARNVHQAFDWVSEKLDCVRPDQVKQLYYQAERDRRFRAVLVERPDQAPPATVEEIVQLQESESLRHGQRITRTFGDPELGTVQLRIEAKP